MTHTEEFSLATTVAARGTRYNKANSPKLPPAVTVCTNFRVFSCKKLEKIWDDTETAWFSNEALHKSTPKK